MPRPLLRRRRLGILEPPNLATDIYRGESIVERLSPDDVRQGEESQELASPELADNVATEQPNSPDDLNYQVVLINHQKVIPQLQVGERVIKLRIMSERYSKGLIVVSLVAWDKGDHRGVGFVLQRRGFNLNSNDSHLHGLRFSRRGRQGTFVVREEK